MSKFHPTSPGYGSDYPLFFNEIIITVFNVDNYIKLVSFTFQTLICPENFYGEDCSIECIAQDTCGGHFACDSDGALVCSPTWTGKILIINIFLPILQIVFALCLTYRLG